MLTLRLVLEVHRAALWVFVIKLQKQTHRECQVTGKYLERCSWGTSDPPGTLDVQRSAQRKFQVVRRAWKTRRSGFWRARGMLGTKSNEKKAGNLSGRDVNSR